MEKKEQPPPQPPLKRARYADEAEAEEDVDAEGSTLSVIAELMQELSATTQTSVGGAAPNLPAAPGLVVKGREVSVPLGAADASFLQTEGTLSPHGRGMETVVDTRVRSSKEFSANDFSFANPLWTASVAALAQEVATQLGAVGCKVEARPYKLLLYSQGDHFLPHRDTEKEKGMFATLIIQLPSRCQGGALVVSQGGVRQTYDFGESSGMAAFQCHFAGHYADVEHEVREVTSGHRLAVVYNLIWTNPRLPPPSFGGDAFQRRVTEFAKAIARWKGVKRGIVVMPLEHLYTEEGLAGRGLAALKGNDRELASALCSANELLDPKHRVNLFVISVDYTRTFADTSWDNNPGEDDWEEEDSTEEIHWYNVAGELVHFPELTFDWETEVACAEGCCEPKDIFKFEGETVFEGYTGNEGATKATTYHRSALVIWPKETEVEFRMAHGGLYCGSLYVMEETDKEEQLRKLDQLLDMWSKLAKEDASRRPPEYSFSNKPIAESVTALLQCLPSGDCARLQRLLDLARAEEPSDFSHNSFYLAALGKQLAIAISDEQCASSQNLFQTVKEMVAPWIKDYHVGLEAAAKILEVVVQTNSSSERALQMVDAFAQALKQKGDAEKTKSPPSRYSFYHQPPIRAVAPTSEWSLQRPLQLLIEKYAWTDIGQHVMTLLHSSGSITLLHRLRLAQCLVSTAPLAAQAIAREAIDDFLNRQDLSEYTKEGSSTENLVAIHVSALVLCAAMDDLERGQKVCDRMQRDARTMNDVLRHLDDKSLFGEWPSFCQKLISYLLTTRVQELEQAVGNGPPKFSFVQRPNPIKVDHPHLFSFLQSPQESLVFSGFKSIAEARAFVNKYSTREPGRDGYSAHFQESGRSTGATVKVTKTKALYEFDRRMFHQNCDELHSHRERLGLNAEHKRELEALRARIAQGRNL
ncbi:Fe2OG dioxygenase domain-containing protein [Balamuthia mandrillaris]